MTKLTIACLILSIAFGLSIGAPKEMLQDMQTSLTANVRVVRQIPMMDQATQFGSQAGSMPGMGQMQEAVGQGGSMPGGMGNPQDMAMSSMSGFGG